MGGVFSRAEGYGDVFGLTGALAFHALCMAAGTYLIGRSRAAKRAAVAERPAGQ